MPQNLLNAKHYSCGQNLPENYFVYFFPLNPSNTFLFACNNILLHQKRPREPHLHYTRMMDMCYTHSLSTWEAAITTIKLSAAIHVKSTWIECNGTVHGRLYKHLSPFHQQIHTHTPHSRTTGVMRILFLCRCCCSPTTANWVYKRMAISYRIISSQLAFVSFKA